MEAPLDTVPLFVLAGSMVPVLDPTVQTLNNATNSSVITWFRKKVVCSREYGNDTQDGSAP